jgi:hypothetical protein
MKNIFCILIFFSGFTLHSQLFAAEIPVRARVFLGSSEGNLANINTELKFLGLDDLGAIPFYGAELTYLFIPTIELGFNFWKRQNVRKSSSPSGTDYGASLDQNILVAIVRVPFLKTSVFRMDVFAGLGGSNTVLSIKSATQSGDITKKDEKDFLAALTTRYGASIAVGFRGVYFFFEGGYESHKIDSPIRTGSLSASISTIDLTGPFGLIGLQFDTPEITRN